MNTLFEYCLTRPLSGLIQGLIMGLLLAFAGFNWVDLRWGRLWAIVLVPLWVVLMAVTVPCAIIYCLVMVMAKGPFWQYPPEQRHSARYPDVT